MTSARVNRGIAQWPAAEARNRQSSPGVETGASQQGQTKQTSVLKQGS